MLTTKPFRFSKPSVAASQRNTSIFDYLRLFLCLKNYPSEMRLTFTRIKRG